jgi:hypothetical protein
MGRFCSSFVSVRNAVSLRCIGKIAGLNGVSDREA